MKKILNVTVAGLTGILLITGCAGSDSAETGKDAAEVIQEETAKATQEEPVVESTTSQDKDNTEEKPVTDTEGDEIASEEQTSAALSEAQCTEKIGQLKTTTAVHPADEDILKDMTDCATCSGVIDKQGVIFSEMDMDSKARLRYRIFCQAMWENSAIYDDSVVEINDYDRGIPLEEAKNLLADAYGESEDISTSGRERIEDGYLIPEFADGDPVDLLTSMQFFEDEEYILVTGPLFYESNGEGELFKGCADILFKKNPDCRFGVTMLFGKYRDVNISIASVETSSELPGSGDKSYAGKNLIDGDPSTVWVEGVPGTGVGETVTLHLDKKQPVYGIQIVNGYTASYDQYNNNGMLTDVEVDFGNGAGVEGHELEGYGFEGYTPQDFADMNRFKVGLDEPVITDTITITLTGAKKGAKYDDTCVSEIWVYGPGE